MPAIFFNGLKTTKKQSLLHCKVNIRPIGRFICFLMLCSTVHALELPFFDQGIPFEVLISTEESASVDQDLVNVIKEVITEQRKENLTLKSLNDPAKISRFEQDIIRKILKSQGYYRFLVESQIISDNPTSDQKKQPREQNTIEEEPSVTTQASEQIRIIYRISPGNRYIIESIDLKLPGVDLDKLPPLNVATGDPLLAEKILSAMDTIKTAVQKHYCFYDFKLEYNVRVNHQTSTAFISFDSRPGQQATFGQIEIEGLETVDQDYIRSFIRYQENDCFQREKVHNARLAILRSNLIANASIDIEPVENGQVKTRFLLNERHHRTIKAGLGYSTDEGPYITAGWEHRNIQGSGEKLDINTRLSAIRQKLAADFFIPTFFEHNKSLNIYSEAVQEDLDAYEALSLKAGIKVGFRRGDTLQYSLGTELKVSDVEDEDTSENFHLLSFPLEIQWDQTNSLLDPTSGFLVNAEIRPYVDLINTEINFLKSLLSVSVYQSFDVALQPTLALRYSLGSISGEPVENIPADERFYVGGGGSVRGYPYQSLSKLNNDDPEGGASFQQINTELRIRFYENWGLATFVGGGFAFEEANLPFDQDLLWGAGLGLRYYTSFAPLRMDLAFPLNRRKDYDDSFQLYISIGQAF